MSRRRVSLLLLPVLLVAALFGCDPSREAPGLLPTTPEQGLLSGVLDGEEEYTLVTDTLLPGLTAEDLTTSSLIGVEGGTLSLLDHTLTVPAGAVSEPTLFTLTVLSSGYVEVDLSATVGLLDVGSDGFAKPVPVSLTYSRSTNVEKKDEDKLVVVRVLSEIGYEELEALPSVVDKKSQTVTTELDHFSRYCLAMP